MELSRMTYPNIDKTTNTELAANATA